MSVEPSPYVKLAVPHLCKHRERLGRYSPCRREKDGGPLWAPGKQERVRERTGARESCRVRCVFLPALGGVSRPGPHGAESRGCALARMATPKPMKERRRRRIETAWSTYAVLSLEVSEARGNILCAAISAPRDEPWHQRHRCFRAKSGGV